MIHYLIFDLDFHGVNLIYNGLHGFRPGFLPWFPADSACHNQISKPKVSSALQSCAMKPFSSTDGVWFPKWAEALAQARLRKQVSQASVRPHY